MGWVVTAGASEEDAAATAVLNEPVASRGGEEGEGEVSGKGGGAGCWRGRVRRDGGVEGFVLFEEAEEGRDVELAKAPEQGSAYDDQCNDRMTTLARSGPFSEDSGPNQSPYTAVNHIFSTIHFLNFIYQFI
jgi:hypothetical protein